jgi:hypothetical protein
LQIAYSVLNKVVARGGAHFSDVALVLCPNLTIKGRLGELDPATGEASIYQTRDLMANSSYPRWSCRTRSRIDDTDPVSQHRASHHE